MLPVKPILDPVNKTLHFDVDGTMFDTEHDARYFAVAETAIKVLKDLCGLYHNDAIKSPHMKGVIDRAHKLIGFVHGDMVQDCEKLERVKKLFRTYTQGSISVDEFSIELDKLFN